MPGRKGVTPVIAIVLLLMMTVAAAGGAYTWFSQMQQDVQDRASSQLNTRMNVRDLQCNVDVSGSSDVIDIALKNSGDRDVLADSVDVFAYDSSNALNITATQLDWGNEGFSNAGGFDRVRVWVNGTSGATFLQPGEFYTVEIDFTNVGVTVNAGSCIAQQ